MKNKDWFSTWFNTKYYHILYKNRNDDEAQFFMRNLLQNLKINPEDQILDLACGKGRHAIYLNSLGYKVRGVDLSSESIKHAAQFSNEKLSFSVHDMRDPFNYRYDYILNLFTSFGYFESDHEDIQVLCNIKKGLKKDGIAVIDYLNINQVLKTMKKNEVKRIDGIDFHIHKEVIDGFLIKSISFEDGGKNYAFDERVKCLDETKMKHYLEKANLKLIRTFGNYSLEPFTIEKSPRLILVVQ